MLVRLILHLTIAGVWALCAAESARAQSHDLQYEGRILAHAQLVPRKEGVGFAGWAVLPDVTRAPFRALLLGGLMHRSEKRWIEVMAGAFVTSDNRNTFVIDVRVLDRSIKKVGIFADIDYRPWEKKLAIMPSVTTSFKIRRIPLTIGAEADMTISERDDVLVLGPRIGFPFPLCKRACKSAALTTSFRFATNGRKVIRQYLVFNF